MALLVDDRAGSSALVPHLTALGAPAILSRLDYGDVSFAGSGPNGSLITTGVEVKSLADVLSCIKTGRLAGHQLPGMQRQYDRYWLLVYGLWRPDPGSGVLMTRRGGSWVPAHSGVRRFMAADLEKYFLSVAIQTGTQVWPVGSLEQGARWIASLYDWWQKDWDKHKATCVFDESGPLIQLEQPSLLRRWAKELPGIGWERSKAVEQAFPSPAIMAACDEERYWRQIDGVGKTIARRVVLAMQGFE